jgi:hypothetical protein
MARGEDHEEIVDAFTGSRLCIFTPIEILGAPVSGSGKTPASA